MMFDKLYETIDSERFMSYMVAFTANKEKVVDIELTNLIGNPLIRLRIKENGSIERLS